MVKVIQINVGGFDNNFSYLVLGTGKHAKEGVLIDPTGSVLAIENEVSRHSAKITLQLFTHIHSDHTELLKHFAAKGVPAWLPKAALLGTIEEVSTAGLIIKAIHTPGHTKESVCFLIGSNLFSGDTLFVRGVGSTAYGGNKSELDETLGFLCTLNGSLSLWPGHNYSGSGGTLGAALQNSHIKPGKKALDALRKKVADYEEKNKK